MGFGAYDEDEQEKTELQVSEDSEGVDEDTLLARHNGDVDEESDVDEMLNHLDVISSDE